MKQNINNVLLNHFTSGGGAAAYLRKLIPSLPTYIQDFFHTRSDIQRIQMAEKLTEEILNLTDFSDIIPLRAEVATLELKRLIHYQRQTDHTAHTVYLFLLGIWIYDNIPQLSDLINKEISSKKPIKMFIFRWTFASLLHDVGYLFYNYTIGENKTSWDKFGDMFNKDFIMKHVGKPLDRTMSDLETLYNEFSESYVVPSYSEQSSALELIDKLDDIPWIDYLLEETQPGLKILSLPEDKHERLILFTQNVATNGYVEGKVNPEVDHAVASGLMLLKYTSVWYWIYKKAMKHYPNLYAELTKSYNYPEDVFRKHVIPACRAVAYHNIKGMKFNYEKHPLLYLEVLCDELQMWDRFWSGTEYFDKWQEYEHCMAEQLSTEISFINSYEYKINFIVSKKLQAKLTSALDEKLEDWQSFIKLTRE
jgi:hypothetical protein